MPALQVAALLPIDSVRFREVALERARRTIQEDLVMLGAVRHPRCRGSSKSYEEASEASSMSSSDSMDAMPSCEKLRKAAQA